MRRIRVHFSGGPLDGRQRTECLPEHWEVLRVEHHMADRLHVYVGATPGTSRDAILYYEGAETCEAWK